MKLKKLAIAGLLLGTMVFAVGCTDGFDQGELLYNDRFEVIQHLEYVYEVRDRETGVHYLADYGTNAFCPLYDKDGKVKITQVNEKYIKRVDHEDED
jgi:hypothetical protein